MSGGERAARTRAKPTRRAPRWRRSRAFASCSASEPAGDVRNGSADRSALPEPRLHLCDTLNSTNVEIRREFAVNRRCLLRAVLVAASLLFSFSVFAHHSLALFDVTAPLWIKGAVVRFERVNPHSLIFLDEKMPDGKTRRWAINGPSIVQ